MVTDNYVPDFMPRDQRNAHLQEQMVMRVGIPHKTGRLTREAFDQGYPCMVSASAFWNARAGRFDVPEYSNLYEADMALDSAGFVATLQRARNGPQPGIGGVYPWSMADYVTLASLTGCSWVSAPDMCCEPAIAANEEEVDRRVRKTAELLDTMLWTVYDYQYQLSKEVGARTAQNMVRIPVPIVQGYSVDSYLLSLELTMKVWERWMPWIGPPLLIGVGSVCRREVNHPEHGLLQLLARLEREIPRGSRLHLFGAKGTALDHVRTMPFIASVDSMAWDFGARMSACKAQVSNTMTHRCAEMNEWMRRAGERLKPRAGDQFRLGF